MRQREGAQFYARYPAWSLLGQMVADALSAVDVLAAAANQARPPPSSSSRTPLHRALAYAPPPSPVQSGGFLPAGDQDGLPPIPTVDPARIFLAGYSIGGAAALHAAAFDGRVAGVGTVSGWTPMRNDSDARPSGGVRRWWDWHATQPRLGWFAGDEAALPYDWGDVLGLLRPRPVYAHQPADDRMCNASEVAAVVAGLRSQGYAALTAATPPGVNRLDAEARAALLAWLAGVSGVSNL